MMRYFAGMTGLEILGLSVALLVMFAGFIGSMVPGLPGTPVILAAAVVHRLCFGSHGPDNPVLISLVVLTLLALLLDYAAGMLGAKRFGATWRGVLGAAVGGVVGLFFNLPGIILGPFVGATLFESLGGREFKKASRAGLGATIGLLAGIFGKCAVSIAMIGLFSANVIYRSLH
jgi:uncharacterized protein YqgC (DUF456 family)